MADHRDRVGQQVGDYRLLRWLGGGGFGDVYLGERLRERTLVAVKVLQARLTRHEELKEFINEARTMRLKHPHIISLLDFGIASDDTPFLVMTYAPHGTLRDRHPKGSRLPLSTIVSYVQELSSALQYAHSLRLIHRDVKPENMLVGSRQEVLLSDFGMVAVAHSSRSLSTEQGIGGTLPYMAPEQIAGKPRAASDQYALGIVVYEWITGKRPFTGTAVEIAMQHATTPPPSLREQIPTLPVDVEQVVLIALAKDPRSRFADVEAFAKAFEQASQQAEMPKPPTERFPSVLSSLPVQDPISTQPPAEQANVVDRSVTNTTFPSLPAASFPGVEGMASNKQSVDELFTPPHHSPAVSALSGRVLSPSPYPPPASTGIPQGLRRRRLSWRTAVLLLVLALLLGSAGGLYATTRISTARTQATATANAQASATTNAFLTSTAQAYATATARARATARAAADAYARFVASNGIMFGFDAQHTHANPYEQILNPTTVGGLTKKWAYHTGNYVTSSPVVANGVVYFGSSDNNVYALDAASGTKKWAYPTGGATSSPAVANGVVYIGSFDGTLYALDATSGTKKWVIHTAASILSSPAVVNGVVYIGGGDGILYALDAASGRVKWAYPTGDSITSSPAVAGGVVYVGLIVGLTNGYINGLYALDAASGTKKWVYLIEGNDIFDSSPAVAGGVVYICSYNGTLYALDAASGAKKWAYPTGGSILSSPAVVNGVVYIGSDDGNLYAFHLPNT